MFSTLKNIYVHLFNPFRLYTTGISFEFPYLLSLNLAATISQLRNLVYGPGFYQGFFLLA